jgi:hypothetical protein
MLGEAVSMPKKSRTRQGVPGQTAAADLPRSVIGTVLLYKSALQTTNIRQRKRASATCASSMLGH